MLSLNAIKLVHACPSMIKLHKYSNECHKDLKLINNHQQIANWSVNNYIQFRELFQDMKVLTVAFLFVEKCKRSYYKLQLCIYHLHLYMLQPFLIVLMQQRSFLKIVTLNFGWRTFLQEWHWKNITNNRSFSTRALRTFISFSKIFFF